MFRLLLDRSPERQAGRQGALSKTRRSARMKHCVVREMSSMADLYRGEERSNCGVAARTTSDSARHLLGLVRTDSVFNDRCYTPSAHIFRYTCPTSKTHTYGRAIPRTDHSSVLPRGCGVSHRFIAASFPNTSGYTDTTPLATKSDKRTPKARVSTTM
jgi:hypothetical protein